LARSTAGRRSSERTPATAGSVDVLKAQHEEAAHTVQQRRAALAKGERDLSFTVIPAPLSGVVGIAQFRWRLGAAEPSLIPLGAVYICYFGRCW
jgi:membrane fusion protein (multidrug efflux system)